MEARLDMFLEENHRSLGNARSPEVDTPMSNRASNTMEGTNDVREPSVGAKCKLLSWYRKGEVVAEGEIFSTNSIDLVHFKPLGLDAWKISVDIAVDKEAYLWRSQGG